MFLSALELLKNAIAKAGYTDKIVIGMDVAASEFYKGGKYDLDFKSPDDPSRYISGDQLGDLYKSFIKDYPGKCLARYCFLYSPFTLCRKKAKFELKYNWTQYNSDLAARG